MNSTTVQMNPLARPLIWLGVAGVISAVGLAMANYWNTPSPDVCTSIQAITGEVIAGCGPINWTPFWVVFSVGVALLVVGEILRSQTRGRS